MSKKTTTYITKLPKKEKENHVVLKGKKNETTFPDFVDICKKSQYELKEWLSEQLVGCGYDVIIKDGYVYAKGTVPVLLTAHMDTVHREPIKDFYELIEDNKTYISSPQGIGGDDRCGIYMILEIIKTHKCSVLFCEDEEVGGIGSTKFCRSIYLNDLEQMKYLIELDRANGEDAVFYDCDNPEFTDFIEKNTGYKDAWGSFSDISHLAPASGVAAVNLSCGYYDAHQKTEYVIVEEMLNTIQVVKDLLDVECEPFEYVESRYSGGFYGDSWYDDFDYEYYDRSYGYERYSESKSYQTKLDRKLTLYVNFVKDGVEEWDFVEGSTMNEAWGMFFLNNQDIAYKDVLDYDVELQ